MTFHPYPKTPRLDKPIIVTEKIDGTNALVDIHDAEAGEPYPPDAILAEVDGFHVLAGSRKRYVTPEADNFGFAQWVLGRAEELVKLGPGRHYGEWWGHGIQRGYDQDRKRLSLFAVDRYDELPECVDYVPVLLRWGTFDTAKVHEAVGRLMDEGSLAAPGFMHPEGAVVYHTAAHQVFKIVVDK